MYHKQAMTLQDCQKVSREIEILASQRHEHLLALYAAFEDLDGVCLVQEFAGGGDLYRAAERHGGMLPETQVSTHVVRPLLAALAELHSQDIVHRDVKPENILLASDGSIRLADFGLAIDTTRDVARARVGTLDYLAPELVGGSEAEGAAPSTAPREGEGAYGSAVDVWAAGVLAYELMLGGPPFEADSQQETLSRICTAEPFLPSHWSPEAKSFLQQALSKDPARRPTAEALMSHPWLNNIAHSQDTTRPTTPKQ